MGSITGRANFLLTTSTGGGIQMSVNTGGKGRLLSGFSRLRNIQRFEYIDKARRVFLIKQQPDTLTRPR
ncbi:hypothetical protein GA0061070_101769 [Kosakonia oryziphila]|uniref:Uncharacterized protein n=1 Tax=Kosakonia oryziphila TaxID=1005667 RepID=A0A1C4DPW5_9ENTR|nr:hypothetical protein GA0061070_101769 [Kosakonia oryziphila]